MSSTLYFICRELNSTVFYVCKLSFNEKKSLLSFDDVNYRKEKMTAKHNRKTFWKYKKKRGDAAPLVPPLNLPMITNHLCRELLLSHKVGSLLVDQTQVTNYTTRVQNLSSGRIGLKMALLTTCWYHPNALRNEFNSLFHLARIELNGLYVCKLSFNEKEIPSQFGWCQLHKRKDDGNVSTQRDWSAIIKVLPSGKMAFRKNACGDISPSSELAW